MKPTYEELEQRLIESERYGRQTDITIDNLEMKLAQMDAFVDTLLSIVWQGGSVDGADIQELALKHGLLRQEVYSADEHETLVDDPGNFENGDPVYFRVETPSTDSFLAEVRAQGVEMVIAAKKHQKEIMHTDTFGYGAAQESLRNLVNELELFAAQLRQEAAQ